MTDQPAPDPRPVDALDPAAERAARQCRVLAELAEIGLRLAMTLERQAAAQNQIQDVAEQAGVTEVVGGSVTIPFRGDRSRAYARLTRAIRLTQMLENRIAEGESFRLVQVAETRAKTARAARAAAESAWTEARNDAVLQVVERTLEADGQDDETILERLGETREKLCDEEDFDITELPVGLVIARICAEFGVEPDWSLWADEAWAVEEAQDKPRGSPYARGGFGGKPPDSSEDADTDLAEPTGGAP